MVEDGAGAMVARPVQTGPARVAAACAETAALGTTMLPLTALLLLVVLRPRVKSLVELVVVTRPPVGEGGRRLGSG